MSFSEKKIHFILLFAGWGQKRVCINHDFYEYINLSFISEEPFYSLWWVCPHFYVLKKEKKKKPILRLLAHLVGLKVCLSLPSFLPTFNLLVHLHLSIPFGMFLIYTTCVFVGDTIKLHMCVIKTTDVTIFQLEYGFLNALSLWLELFSVYWDTFRLRHRGNSVLECLSWCVVPHGTVLQKVMEYVNKVLWSNNIWETRS